MTSLACSALIALFALGGSSAVPVASVVPAAQRSPATAPAADLVLRLYDVRDLPGLATAPSEPAAYFAQLADVVRAHVEPPLAERHTLSLAETGTLVLNGLPAQHAWVERFLALQRRSAGVFCDLRFRLIELESGGGARLGLGETPRILEADEVDALLRRLEDVPHDLTTAPRVLTSSFGNVHVAVTTEVPFVTEYREHTDVEPGRQTLVVPVLKSVHEGQELHNVVVRLAEDLVLVDFELVLREVQRPLEVVPTAWGDTCRPVVLERRLASEVLLADGATAVFPVLARDGTETVVLLKLNLVTPAPAPSEPTQSKPRPSESDEPAPSGERRERGAR